MKRSILLCLLLAACGGGHGGYPSVPITTFTYPLGTIPGYYVSPYASNLTNPVTQAVEIFNAPPTAAEMLLLTDPVMLSGASGAVQGALSRTILIQPVFLAYDPVTKLISPTAAADIATFIAEFTAAAGNRPSSVFIMDEMLWNGHPNPSPSEITAMANSMQQLVSLWETAAAPGGIGFQVSTFPGLLINFLLNPATNPQVLPLLLRADSIIFKSTLPFEPTSPALTWLATLPEQELSKFCMIPRIGRTDPDLMLCAPELIPVPLPFSPPFSTTPILGLSFPATLAAADVSNPAALLRLETAWTDLHAVMSRWTHSGNSQRFVTPWVEGFNGASPFNGTPGFASGRSFMTPVMIEELKAALTIELIDCWAC